MWDHHGIHLELNKCTVTVSAVLFLKSSFPSHKCTRLIPQNKGNADLGLIKDQSPSFADSTLSFQVGKGIRL